MEKILLVGINARYTHTNLALRYLRNLTPSGKYDVKLLEFSINQHSLDILSEIIAEKPDIVAISVYIWNTTLVKSLLPNLFKVLPTIKIILGGPEVSYNAVHWLQQFPEISCIISGSGEAAWQHLMQNNMHSDEQIISSSEVNISDLPFPYLKEELAELEHKYIYYEASRGCPFKCSYCLSSRSDQKLQFRALELVKEELDIFCSQQVKIVKFVDRSFNADPQYSRQIWEYLIAKETSTRFHFEVHPALLQPKDFDLLAQVPEGRFQLEIGIQSLSPQVLKAIGRNSGWESIKEKILTLTGLKNLHVHVDLIVGLPFEDTAGMEWSFNQVFQLQADHFQLGFLKVLPGTEMAEKCKEYGISHTAEPPYEVLSTNWMNFTEIDHYRKISHLLDALYNTNHFPVTLKELVKNFNSPLALFQNYHSWLQRNNFSEVTRNWQSNGRLISRFIADFLPEKLEFFLDCLRWDWCAFASSHYYPEFLQNNALQEAKKKGRDMIREFFQNDFPIKELNRAIFFIPVSEKFSYNYMENKSMRFS